MPPEAASILDDLLSCDPIRIWKACWAVRHCHERRILQTLGVRAEDIRKSTQGIDLGGVLHPNSSHLEFAMRKITFAATSDACLCAIFSSDDRSDPVRLSNDGVLRIDTEKINREEQTKLMECTCPVCERQFQVTEITSYHYPWWKWESA